jgi:hypothetical protein
VNLAASLNFPRECAPTVRPRRHRTLLYFTKYAFNNLALAPHDLSTCVTMNMCQSRYEPLTKATFSNYTGQQTKCIRNQIVDSSSIAESKYGLRSQFLAIVVMMHEVWLKT